MSRDASTGWLRESGFFADSVREYSNGRGRFDCVQAAGSDQSIFLNYRRGN
ncbi:hypothetical protein OH687_34955 [Burkholderia anthina]|nr:hypothetical protein OH687_34955 [Burkholderia anthina]